MGVLVGLAVAGLLVRWHFDDDHDKELLVKRFNEDFPEQEDQDDSETQENEQSALTEKAVLNDDVVSSDDFPERTFALNGPADSDTNENEQNSFTDKAVLNEGVISSDEANSQNSLYKAYSRVRTILFFIGYERSRHSLLGALLDAHPHMVVSDESMAFGKWRSNQDKWINSSIYSFYDIMVQTSQRDVAKGKRSQVFEGSVANATSRFKYFVPNQWQGSFDQYIEVIGDKAGAYTARAMQKYGAFDAVYLLEKTTGAKVKFIHVVRNPFDNIATMVLQRLRARREKERSVKVNAPDELESTIRSYFTMAEGSNRAREAFPGSVIDIPSMEIVKNPAETLRRICQFLEIACTEQYLQDCAATVDPVPSITRNFIEWTTEQKNTVYGMMTKYSFFEGYSFDK